MELLRHQIADEGNEEDSYKAGQQLEVTEHDGVTDAACHAQTGALRQRADDHGQARASQTGACFEPGPASLSLKMTGTVRNSSRITVMLTGRTTPSSGTES